jgi:hypothetical protein
MYYFDKDFVILLALGSSYILLPNMITIVVPLPFWHKLIFFHLFKILKFYFLFAPKF